MSVNLESCPCCKEEVKLHFAHFTYPGDKTLFWIECECGMATIKSEDEDWVILTWNTRPERVCKWEKDRDEWAGEIVFCTECDDEWWLDCDSPEDAGYHYCPNCGGKIEVVE